MQPRVRTSRRHREHDHMCPVCKTAWKHYPTPEGCNKPLELACAKHNPLVQQSEPPIANLLQLREPAMFVIRITERAKAGLVNQAFAEGYIKSTNMRKYKGLGDYIEQHASIQLYEDNRPLHMKAMDNLPIFHNRKMWLPEGQIRRFNTMKLTGGCLERLLAIAEEHGICNMYRLNGPTEKQNVFALVIEAIGQGWLKPIGHVAFDKSAAVYAS